MGIFFVALGLVFLFENFLHHAAVVLPFPIYLVALVFAASFVIGAALLQTRGAGHVRSLLGGAFLGVMVTCLAVLVAGGALYLAGVGGPYAYAPEVEGLLAAVAACLVAGAVVTRLASR